MTRSGTPRGPRGPPCSQQRGVLQFFRETNPMVNQNLCPIEMAILQYLGYVLLVQISDTPLLLHMWLICPFSRCCNLWIVKPAHHGPMKFELFQVTLLQSVKGKVQSATDQTNYCAPGGEFRCKLLPKAPLSSTAAIQKLQFPTLQRRNPPFGNYIPDIQVPKGHVSPCFQLHAQFRDRYAYEHVSTSAAEEGPRERSSRKPGVLRFSSWFCGESPDTMGKWWPITWYNSGYWNRIMKLSELGWGLRPASPIYEEWMVSYNLGRW